LLWTPWGLPAHLTGAALLVGLVIYQRRFAG